MSRMEDKFDSFNNAVKRLNEANIAYRKDKKETLYQDSLIKRFEFTFELGWKALRDFLTEQGYALKIASPKGVISFSYQEGFLADEQVWLSMLQARNGMAHDYDRILAAEIAEDISNRYCKELQKLCKFISENLK